MRWLLPLFAWMLSSAWVGAADAWPERVVRQVDTISVEYSKGDEAFVDALSTRLPGFRLPDLPAGSTISDSDLFKHKEAYLARIAQLLALQQTPKTEGLFIAVAGFFTADLDPPHHYGLWRKSELIARLKAGEQIAGFSMEGPDGVRFAANFPQIKNTDDGEEVRNWPAKMREYWVGFQMPIQIGKGASPEADIEAGLKQVTDLIGMFRGGSRPNAGPFVVLHEVTEFSIITDYLTSRDRRWFCDGVANYVAWKVLAEQLGAERARQYYDLDRELKKYAAQADTVDLENWPALEAMKAGSYSEDLNTANYAFATRVIAAVCAKHGDTLLPRLFTEIRKTPREKATMKTVYAAFKKITREDLRSYLPKTKKPSPVAKQK